MTTATPVTWLNYKGDTRGNLGRVLGPNMDGEHLRIVTEDYDPATGRTRTGLSYLLTEDADA